MRYDCRVYDVTCQANPHLKGKSGLNCQNFMLSKVRYRNCVSILISFVFGSWIVNEFEMHI